MIELIKHSVLHNDDGGTAFFLQKGCRRNITILRQNSFNFDITRNYFLSIPDVVFKISYKTIKESFCACGICVAAVYENEMYFLPLPNIFDDTSVCLGEEIDYPAKIVSFQELAKIQISYFWGSIFDPREVMSIRSIKDHFDFSLWARYTKENPNWHPTNYDLRKLSSNAQQIFLKNRYGEVKNIEFGPQYERFQHLMREII